MKVTVNSASKNSSLELPDSIFKVVVSDQLLAQYIRVYLSNQRQATAQTLTRGEVTGTTAKVWKQKGTGRARHGSRKAPLFVGGGKAHGPKPAQHYKLTMSATAKKAALKAALSLRVKDLIVVDQLAVETTKTLSLRLRELVPGTESILIIADAPEKSLTRACNNLPFASITSAARLNAYEVMTAKTLVVTTAAITRLIARLSSPAEEAKE